MYFKQFYLGCLAHASYLIGSEGEAAVIDPQRDVDQYLNEAAAQGLKIKYIIETHLHADFVSGHRELAAHSGAEIVYSEKAGVEFPHHAVRDGDELTIGRVILRILATPGHTPESISILVIDKSVSDEPRKILTGDTLFIGDVGRPDLVGAKGYSKEAMAAMLYDSLHEKILKLNDAVEVYPAHGAGSMCGRNISKDTSSTIGEQRRFNYALQPMAKEDFVRMMTVDLPEQPRYFSRDAEINRTGAALLEELPPPIALTPDEVNKLAQQGATILDVRNSSAFGAAHIPKAVNIALQGQFASWAGCLLNLSAPIVLVAESTEGINEAAMRLARVGIENVKGYLQGGMQSWVDAGYEVRTVAQIAVDELNHLLREQDELQVIDVRRPAEYQSGHAPRAMSIPLSGIENTELNLDTQKPTAVICAGGYRSSAATSILEKRGFKNLFNVVGGTSAWIQAGFPVEQ